MILNVLRWAAPAAALFIIVLLLLDVGKLKKILPDDENRSEDEMRGLLKAQLRHIMILLLILAEIVLVLIYLQGAQWKYSLNSFLR